MKTRALALIALAVGLAGCRENLTSVQANGFCAPPADAAACGIPSCDAFVSRFELGGGTSGDGSLISWIQWQNNMADNSVKGERLNTNDFTIEGYEWEIIDPVNTTTIRDRFASTMPIKAGGTAIIGIEVVPPAGTKVLQDDHSLWSTDDLALMPVRVNIKAFGRLGDDSYYETGTVQAAVYFFKGFVSYTCPTPGDTLVSLCPPSNQWPVTLNCVAPDATTP